MMNHVICTAAYLGAGINLRSSVASETIFRIIRVLSIALVRSASLHSSVLFHLLSLTLTRSNSWHCSLFLNARSISPPL